MADLEKVLLGDEVFSQKMNALIKAIKDGGGGGGGGTSDYTALTNKPQINGTILNGNKTSSELGLVGLLGYVGEPGSESTPYNFPYHIENLRFDSTTKKILGTLKTIVIDTKAKNQFPLEVALTNVLTTSDIVNNLTTDNDSKALASSQGKILNDRINNLSVSGRWLTYIDCANQAVDNMPPSLPYQYKNGDYFIVKVGGTKKPKNNVSEIPAGAVNIEWESTTQVSKPGDVWRYDAANQAWLYEPDYTVVVSFTNITGSPMDNTSLASLFNAKQDSLTAEQLAAVNSGITAAKVSTYDGYATGKQDKIAAGTDWNILAYSGTAGTLKELTRSTSITAASTDTEIPTAKATHDELVKKQDTIKYVVLAAGTSTGTITDAELQTLQASKDNKIMLDNEIYKLEDNKTDSGYLAYSHIEKESTSHKVKTITLTISTKAWIKKEQFIPTVNDPEEVGKFITNLKINASGVITSDKKVALDIIRNSQINDAQQAVAFHNAIPGGRNISSYFNDATDWEDNKPQFWKRLQGGTFNRSAAWIAAHPDDPTTHTYTLFEGLFPGDYWTMTEKIRSRQDNNGTAQTNEGTEYVMIAGFDTLWGNGDGTDNVTYHHIVCIPGTPDTDVMNAFGQHRMNSTNTTENGYKGSQMNTSVIGSVTTTGIRFSASNIATINNQLFAEFGAHLATTRELLSNAMQTSRVNRWGEATGGASGWEWVSCQAVLMSEVEVYGSIAVSSTAHDVGNAKNQLPVFRFFPTAINNRKSWYWLKAIGGSPCFCGCSYDGYAFDYGASEADFFVRPRFVLKA